MRTVCSLLALVLGSSSASLVAAPSLDPATLHQKIVAKGARSAVRGLSEKQYSWILDQAERGDARWIRMLIELKPGTDGWLGEAVTISLSRALQTNPTEILRAISKGYESVPSICTDNDIEPSDRSVRTFNANALKALAVVKDPALSKLRAACIANFRK